ncbi:hypothetical protein VTN77DRAFT_6359 [Rasamsonia byssochlamydoides]|uniref:uncharacterized protein n=1 Tax=Rasamsonia byssochlamydoides TaxID=89139 RepID=UPI00374241B0
MSGKTGGCSNWQSNNNQSNQIETKPWLPQARPLTPGNKRGGSLSSPAGGEGSESYVSKCHMGIVLHWMHDLSRPLLRTIMHDAASAKLNSAFPG